MTKLEEMVEYLLDEQNKGKNELFYITVNINDAKNDEMLINHVNQLESKVKYYKTTYDNNLKHNHANVIVTDYGFIPGNSRLSNELEELI